MAVSLHSNETVAPTSASHAYHKSRIVAIILAIFTVGLARESDMGFANNDHWNLLRGSKTLDKSSTGDQHYHFRLIETEMKPAAVSDSQPDAVMSVLTYPKTVSSNGQWFIYADTSVNSTKGYPISCFPYTNLTPYDHLRGISVRTSFATLPEPEVLAVFKKGGLQIKLDDVVRRVSDRLTQNPSSPQYLNQAGNLLRVYGYSLGAVECFRKALFYSPSNSDVLLNLARVLFNHKYLEDAIYLTRRSLETQPSDRNAWLQHFTLGEILRAHGQSAEAVHHLRHALSLNPNFQPAMRHLKQLEPSGQPSLTIYTLAIIAFLVLGVLATLVTTAEANLDSYGEVMKTQRHFNRALAMAKISFNNKLVRPPVKSATSTTILVTDERCVS